MTQPEALALFAHIEELCGEELTVECVQRFAQTTPLVELSAHADGCVDLKPLYRPGHLGLAPRGEVRPVWGEALGPRGIYDAIAPRLLLYVDSVIETSHRLEPFNVAGMEGAFESEEYVRRQVSESLEWLVRMRPLIEDGSVLFTSKFRGMAIRSLFDPRFLEPPVRGRPSSIESVEYQLSGNIAVAEESSGTPLALTRDEERVYASMLSGHSIDGDVSKMTTLARVPVPEFRGDIGALVKMRQEEDAFTEWRGHLKSALSRVESIPQSPQGVREAADVITTEMTRSAHAIGKAVRKSPFMAGLQTGQKGLGLTALGAVTGAMVTSAIAPASAVGPFVGAAAGAASGITKSAAEAGMAYFAAARARNRERAVLNVMLTFRSLDSRLFRRSSPLQ